MNLKQKTRISTTNWLAIVLLALSGQVAWAVENTWFNTFVNDEISQNPEIIFYMVSASAITATVTTFIMGALSDRVGKRKIIILFGYILWGISTALFPLSAYAKTAILSIVLLIILDCIMTFFGSTANDACFNAWITDVTDKTNRGTVSGILEMFPLVALVITTVASGIVIENFGYTVFFVSLGIIVATSGIIGCLFMKDKSKQQYSKSEISFATQLLNTVSFKVLKTDKRLKWLLICTLVFTAAEQISTPYQIIYFTDTLGFNYGEVGLYLGVMTLLAGLSGIVFGFAVDKVKKEKSMAFALIVSAVGFFLVSLAKDMLFLCIGIFVMAFGIVAKIIVGGAWLRDMTPPKDVGGFQGVRMVFRVLLPMIIGPYIGQFLISTFGYPVSVDGSNGFSPSAIIFVVAGVCTLLAFIPLYFITKTKPLSEEHNVN